MAKAPEVKKLRVYEVAKDLGMSSEAVLQIVRRLGAEVKNHMSTLSTEIVEKVRGEISQKAAVVKEEQARKHEIELHRARELAIVRERLNSVLWWVRKDLWLSATRRSLTAGDGLAKQVTGEDFRSPFLNICSDCFASWELDPR